MNSAEQIVLVLENLVRAGVALILRTSAKVDFCPEGTIGVSLGFQPQVSIKYVSRPGRAAAEPFPQVMGYRQTNNRTKNPAPVQGASWAGVLLGLKPQAESYSPFGTMSFIQPKYLSTKSKSHQRYQSSTRTSTTTKKTSLDASASEPGAAGI
jgi:hypothetical protein